MPNARRVRPVESSTSCIPCHPGDDSNEHPEDTQRSSAQTAKSLRTALHWGKIDPGAVVKSNTRVSVLDNLPVTTRRKHHDDSSRPYSQSMSLVGHLIFGVVTAMVFLSLSKRS
jgi:hypothetical protein